MYSSTRWSRSLRLREFVLCAAASVLDEVNCVPSACGYSGRYVCDTTDKLEATEVQWSFVLCVPPLPKVPRIRVGLGPV